MSYEKVAKLGKGAYGIVYSAKSADKKDVVIKRVLFEKKSTDVLKGLLGIREVDYAKSLNHPYILTALDLLHEKPFSKLSPRRGMRDDKVYLVFPRAKYTMEELIYQCETPISHMKRAMFQCLVGLDYLHSRGICHRDIKPDNMLCFYENGVLTTKICDFGMSKPLLKEEKNSTHVVTSVYRPPEILLGSEYYDFSIDIWALGVSFYEMVYQNDLFPDCGNVSHLNYIFKLLGTPKNDYFSKFTDSPTFKHYDGLGLESKMKRIPKDFETPVLDNLPNPGSWNEFIDLLKNMIQIDPKKRFTPYQCIRHPFFSGFYKDDIDTFELILRNEPYPTITWTPIQTNVDVIGYFKPYFEKMKNEYHRILFFAIDIFMRVSNKTDNHDEICKVCIYLAFKYFMDVQSPSWKELFGTRVKNNLTKMETFIIKDCLNYEVFRPLLWDIVYPQKKDICPLTMLEFIVSGKSDYSCLL